LRPLPVGVIEMYTGGEDPRVRCGKVFKIEQAAGKTPHLVRISGRLTILGGVARSSLLIFSPVDATLIPFPMSKTRRLVAVYVVGNG